jgi:hypothetical protein
MDLLRLTVALLYGSLGLIAFFLVLVALFPAPLARTQANAEGLAGRQFVVGLVHHIIDAAVLGALFALRQWTQLQILGLPIVAVLVVHGRVAFGLGGMADDRRGRLPERPAPYASAATPVWLACAPFVGWNLLPWQQPGGWERAS